MKRQGKKVAAILFAVLMISAALLCLPKEREAAKYTLPVLLYHHFDENVTADTVVSPGRFREQMMALREAGYVTVTLSQVADYVDHGTPLPEKAVLITMDDGYTSNFTVAAPILEELGMCATVFLIGIYEGENISPHTGNPLYPPRFSYEDVMEWVEKGVLDLQSHTFDMHQRADDGFSGRDGILRMEGESLEAYCTALRQDAQAFVLRRAEHGIPTQLTALAYPYGYVEAAAANVLREEGIRFTFTVAEHHNILRIGDEACLWDMGRFNVTDRDSGESLVRRLEQ